ncbi:asparagine synthase (glutamine-hydrolyzing) [Planosporangium thailandense]|uniref:asparagine synthase (glutamine-hydrolyzing) n=1 Tax=Planosporangium thailandense TaxID=765197 RepID=A0ABX0XZE9_9ACTN|nr:asparagine synthase (glutamine-hydrolyzing) [Planosporangium thailandense]NJC70617.1 asparagine synthase (glutamine-hydrolyzing) [Planosporangium thailandense]
MCGLLTFVSADASAPARRAAVARALERLHHRGPDAGGLVVVDDDAVLGFKRLSIIDVAHSDQPLTYADGRYAITFNGEVYNYLELRKELVREYGARFATEGDAEVVVAAYHHWGAAAVQRLRGMFALVIWDREQRRAFGARDPFGIKPLYHLTTADGTYVASEKKALLPFLAASRDPAGLDETSLSHYLTLQYVPEPASMHHGIARLGPGRMFTLEPGGAPQVERYHRPQWRPTPTDDPEALYRRIRQTLRDSVRLHMRSDVPVGAFLSSGIDSTAVVAFAREFNADLHTFTAALDVPGYSELEAAQRSAEHLGVTMHPVTVTAQMMMDALPRIVWHLDDPVADPALVPLYYVAATAREHVTVALSGEGADELFAGYPIYREPLSLRPVSALPPPLRRGLRAVSRAIPEGVKGRGYLQRGTTDIEERYYGNAREVDAHTKRRLLRRYDPDLTHAEVTGPIYAACADLGDVEKMQYVDLETWLPGDILVKADRMSMAHSLEVRVPFLTQEMFAVAASVPTELKLPPRSTVTKYALRRALADVVPPHIVSRPKLGFPTPIRVWLRSEMYDWALDILGGSGADALLDLNYARWLLEEHRRGAADHSRKLWTVLIFCLWYDMFLGRPLAQPSARAGSLPVSPTSGAAG